MSLYETINNFIANNAIIFSVIIPIISASLGAYVSYRVTIRSEKRKEANEAIEPVLLFLNQSLNFVKGKNYNGLSAPDDDMMFKLKLRLTSREYELFEQNTKRIDLAKHRIWEHQDAYGSYDDQKITLEIHNEIINSIQSSIDSLKMK